MRLGILCPGQGAQNAGMVDHLRGRPEAEAVLASASAVLGVDVDALLSGPPKALFENVTAQPLICAVGLATWAVLRPRLPQPALFAGYSLGELAAYGCAGALSMEATVRLARERALAMDKACAEPCRMLAVRGVPLPSIERLCAEAGVEVAIVNAEDRIVVGGRLDAMDAFEKLADLAQAGLAPLPIGIASHTTLMQSAGDELRKLLADGLDTPPRTPVLASIDGMPVVSARQAVDTLSRQTSETVCWNLCLDALREAGCTVLLELGPGSDLARMAHDRMPEIPVRSVAEFRKIEAVVEWVERAG